MSKEKECKCCHEWWYGSDVKENLCPNCYYYFKQIKQELEEKDKEIEEKMMSFEKRCQEYYKSNEFKRDFAIQELEKVKNFVDGRTYCANYIKKRIKELKGEK